MQVVDCKHFTEFELGEKWVKLGGFLYENRGFWGEFRWF
jgi:hypothetical protein